MPLSPAVCLCAVQISTTDQMLALPEQDESAELEERITGRNQKPLLMLKKKSMKLEFACVNLPPFWFSLEVVLLAF